MKKLRRFAAMMLAIIMATQNVAIACAETVESALNSDTAAVVEESVSSSEVARVFEDSGDSYTLSLKRTQKRLKPRKLRQRNLLYQSPR